MNYTLNYFSKELQLGNQQLFNKLFSDYYVNLCRFAYTFLKDADTSEEVVQEVFINLWEQREKLSISTSIRSFLYTSVRNRALNHIRSTQTRLHHENTFAQEQMSKVEHIINFCEREELGHLVETAIAELPEQCRTVFNLSRNQNLSYNQIATHLNISPKTVENQMGIALKKIRVKLSPYLSSIIAFF